MDFAGKRLRQGRRDGRPGLDDMAHILTIFEDGVVLAKHADGTIIRTCEHHVIVECPGLAAVEIDTDIDATAAAPRAGPSSGRRQGRRTDSV